MIAESVDERATKNVVFNISGSLIIKGVALIVGLATTPAYMSYFSNNLTLGIWFTLLSLLTWILFCDLGLGNGLRNELVVALSKRDYGLARSYISSTYIATALISVVLCVLLLSSILFVDWSVFFGIENTSAEYGVVKSSLAIVFCGVIMQLFLRTSESILYALQKAVIPSAFALTTNIIVLLYLVGSIFLGIKGDLISLSLVYVAATNIPLVLATIYLFVFPLKQCAPTVRSFSIELSLKVIKLGGAFFFLQITALILGTSMVIMLISVTCGPESVVVYGVYNKLFSQFYTVMVIAMVPMWSAVTKALGEGRFAWINSAYRKINLLCLALFLAQFILIPFLQMFFDIWLGQNSFTVSNVTEFIFVLNTGVMLLYSSTSYMCNGLNEVKSQLLWMVVAAIVVVPLTFFFTSFWKCFEAVVLAQSIALLPYCIFQTLHLKKSIRKSVE